MSISAITSLGNTQVGSASWNAIASIKSTSPFGDTSSTRGVADQFDSLIDHSASDSLEDNASSSAGAAAGSTDLALLRQIQNAQQSSIDLFA